MGSSRKKATRKVTHQEQTSAIATRRQQMDTVRDLVERYEEKFQKVLPRYLSAERMIEITMTEIARNPDLLKCTQASLIGCVIQSAQLGLQPGIVGEAYLIPFRNNKRNVTECTLIPGYKGLLKLAFNSGELAAVQCEVVRKGDAFDYRYGTDGYLHHVPSDEDEEVRAMTHAYAVIHMKGSDVPTWEVFNRRKVEKAKKSSRAAASGRSPWSTHEDEMWMKTVLRHVCKRLPASIEKIAQAVALDERADAGIPQDLRVFAPELPELPAGAIEGQVADEQDDDAEPDVPASESGGGAQEQA